MLNTENGQYINCNQKKYITSIKIKQGDKIKLVFDPKSLVISFYINEKSLENNISIKAKKNKLNNFHPCVDLYNHED